MNRLLAPTGRAYAALNDTELIGGALHGDEGAFRTIMERNNQRLFRIARSLLRDDSEAEDVVQEAYLRAFAALSSFRGESSLATWLTSITLNEVRGRKRRQRPTVDLDSIDLLRSGAEIIRFPNMNAELDPEHSAARREIRKILEKAIDALPEAFRIVFVMRDVEEMSIEETAHFLGIRAETVKTRLHRARRLLRQSLDEHLASTLKDAFPFAGERCAHITETVLQRMKRDAAASGK